MTKRNAKSLAMNSDLHDAYEGQGGNVGRVTFREWLREVADDDRHTMRDAAREYIGEQDKPTPGPWEYGARMKWATVDGAARLVEGSGFYFGPADGIDIGEIHCTSSQVRRIQEANARLVAATPDLLAACKDMLERIPDLPHGQRAAYAIVQAALAKAVQP